MMHIGELHASRIAPRRLFVAPLAAVLFLVAPARTAPPLLAKTTPSVQAGSKFLPSKHGFAFVNHFSGSVLPKSFGQLASLISVSSYGLCGGMSFAAADLFLARKVAPSAAAAVLGAAIQPPAGTPLREYLHRRQLDSLGGLSAGFPQAARFAEWMSARDSGPTGTQAMTAVEIARVVRRLAAGNISVLGLVYVGTSGSGSTSRGLLTDNHQVIATAIKPRSGGFDVMLYDPNFPADDTVRLACTPVVAGSLPSIGPCTVSIPIMGLRVNRVARSPDINATAKARLNIKPVRGVFIMPYKPMQPPPDIFALGK